MKMPTIQKFPYTEDSARLFEPLATLPWAVFLDSGRPLSEQGRYDILSADPRTVLVTRGQQTEIRDGAGLRVSLRDPLQLLQESLGPSVKGCAGIPFCGGAIGYFGYDLARRLERLPSLARDTDQLPEMAVGIYTWALVVDHLERRSWLVADAPTHIAEYKRLLLSANRRPQAPVVPFRVLGRVRSNMSRHAYLKSVAPIKDYIYEGDCYQVNFARRFSVAAEGEPWLAYKRLRHINPAPFSAYLNTPHCQVMSSSPERFLRVSGGLVETRPIKGTCPRGGQPAEDVMRAEALRNSAKDRAENLMIVDLLRNDLGRACAFGSIEVPELFKVESFARVHHLVSTVRGRLAKGETATSLLRACFPGGSITGAPKLRAMEIIEELEPHRRGIYCGSIGYLGFNGDMDTSIVIRTMVHAKGMTRFWAGGGIVTDSDAVAEYRETAHKASALLDLLRQMGPGTHGQRGASRGKPLTADR
jgi:para-aminobenzoate synthetase component 1